MPEKLELAGKKVEIEYSVTGKSALIFNRARIFKKNPEITSWKNSDFIQN